LDLNTDAGKRIELLILLSTSHWETGIYFIKINDEISSKAFKITKQ